MDGVLCRHTSDIGQKSCHAATCHARTHDSLALNRYYEGNARPVMNKGDDLWLCFRTHSAAGTGLLMRHLARHMSAVGCNPNANP